MKASKCNTCRNLQQRFAHNASGCPIGISGRCLKNHSPKIYKDGMKRICSDFEPNLIRII